MEAQLNHFAVRFFDAPVAGQIGPQDRRYVLLAKSLAASKRAAKVLMLDRGHVRLVEVFPIPLDERKQFELDGWYINTLSIG